MCHNVMLFKRLSLFLIVLLVGCASNETTVVEATPVKQPAQITSPAPAKPKPKPAAKPAQKTCGITLTDSKQKIAQQYYVKGERLFGDDDITGAKAALKTAVCLQNKHKQASELLNLLDQTYPNR